MKLYKDVFTGDEILTDVYKITEKDVLWEADLKMVQKGGNEDFVLAGANPSPEDAPTGEDGAPVEMVLDIQAYQGVEPFPKPNQKDFEGYIKDYVKRLIGHVKAEAEKTQDAAAAEATVKEFKTNAIKAFKAITENYDNYDVYIGGSFNPQGMFILVDYREDGVTPFVTLWKDGLCSEKI